MSSSGGGTSRWYDDIPPWPATDSTPAQHLARELVGARVGVAVQPRPAQPRDPVPPVEERPSDDQPRDGDYVSQDPNTDWESFLTAEAARSKQKFEPDEAERTGFARLWHDKRGIVLGAAAAILLVLVGATFALVQFAGGGETEVSTAEGSTTTLTDASPSQSDAASACPSTSSGGLTTGNDAGDQLSGPGVIKAFNHAYYVDRSAQKATAMAVPNAVAKASVMQQYIDQRAPGTTHCLSIVNRGNNTYGVSLTEKQPGKPDVVFQQTIEVVETNGKYLIASIKADE
ncbi:hypothetical protein AAFP30_05005 [Gordonia sp. CPCC 205515]|uniref:hypothetical protein n=1 Tax=Gordonia sp. CPCC 205515 TaxID=3140791 RepID=UPI003AF37B45